MRSIDTDQVSVCLSHHHQRAITKLCRARVNNQKKNLLNSNISSTCAQNMVNFGPLTAEIDWEVWGKFQWVSRLSFITVPNSLNRGQPNFARCLAVSWAGSLYIHFGVSWVLPANKTLPGVKFTFHPTLALSYIGSVTAWHWRSRRQPNFAAWHKERNYWNFASRHFQQRVPPIFPGRPWRWA